MRRLLRGVLAVFAALWVVLIGPMALATAATVAITSPTDGSTGPDSIPDVTGTATPGQTIHVTANGIEIGTAVADASGAWSVAVADPVPWGTETRFEAVIFDDANVELARATAVYTRWGEPPAVTFTSPVEGTTTPPQVLIEGTLSGDIVSVALSEAGAPVGTIDSDLGSWWASRGVYLGSSGPHTLTVTVTDSHGRTATASVTVMVDATPPPAPIVVDPPFGSVITDRHQHFRGTGVPGSTVQLVFTNSRNPITDAVVVGADGTWAATAGSHDWEVLEGQLLTADVTAVQTDGFGNEGWADGQYTIDFRVPTATTTTSETTTTTETATSSSTTTSVTPSTVATGSVLPATGNPSPFPVAVLTATAGIAIGVGGVLVALARPRQRQRQRLAGRYRR